MIWIIPYKLKIWLILLVILSYIIFHSYIVLFYIIYKEVAVGNVWTYSEKWIEKILNKVIYVGVFVIFKQDNWFSCHDIKSMNHCLRLDSSAQRQAHGTLRNSRTLSIWFDGIGQVWRIVWRQVEVGQAGTALIRRIL